MSDITLIDDSEQSSLVTNGLVKNGELYLKKAGSTSAGAIVAYDNGVWRTFANEAASYANDYSVSFDGSNDYIQTSYSPASSSGFTMSFWMKSSDTSNSITFVSNGTSDGYPGGFSLLSPSGTKAFYVLIANSSGNTSLNNNVGSSGSTLDVRDGEWHHIAATISGTSVKIYKDGGDAAINSGNPSNTQGTPFATWTSSVAYTGNTGNAYYFGRNGGYNSYFYPGLLDEVALFETELTGSNISAIYNSGVPADVAASFSPTGYWRMGDNDSGTGTTITDQGSGGNDGTLTNGPTFSSDVPS